ncbi:MAG: hypothetical protein D3911_06515 [Candidatus Electrothrix sp. AW3_4]|nr:hypothetical protein [Candidatus Electrothrix gigas]
MEQNELINPLLCIEEYKSLRQQIDSQSKLMIQVFTFSIISSSALLGYFFNLFNNTGLSILTLQLLFGPSLILVPCAYLIKDMRDEIYRWGTYLYVYFEDGSSSHYESALSLMRERYGSSESFNPIFLTFWSFTFICIFLYIILSNQQHVLKVWQALPWLSIVWLLHRAHYQFNKIPDVKRQFYIDAWKSIKFSID